MLTRLTRHAPDRFEAVAQAVIAHEFQRERAVVSSASHGSACIASMSRRVVFPWD